MTDEGSLSWLRKYAPIPEPVDALEGVRRLTAAGLEVEPGGDINDLVVAQVVRPGESGGFRTWDAP